jgi:hypothetical protein
VARGRSHAPRTSVRRYDYGFHRPGLREKVRARNDFERFVCYQPRVRLLVQLDHTSVESADDKQSWGRNLSQRRASEVGAAATRYHGTDSRAQFCRRH